MFNLTILFFEALSTDYGSPVSSFSKDWIENFVESASITEINPTSVKIEYISDFFNHVGYDFDFITIDVEGLSYELLLSVDWNKFTLLELLCIECEQLSEKYIEVMSHYNFILHSHEEGNLFFKKHE